MTTVNIGAVRRAVRNREPVPGPTVFSLVLRVERMQPVLDAARAWLMAVNGQDEAAVGEAERALAVAIAECECWTAQEDNKLLFYVGMEPPESIAQRLGRTERSVIERYKAIHGGSFRQATAQTYGMSAPECARLLGTSTARIHRWVKSKWLKARRRTVMTDKLLTIQADDLEAFIRAKGGLMEGLACTDPYWAAVLDEARTDLHMRYINRADLADIFGVVPSRFSAIHMGKRFGFPSAAFSLRGQERWYEREAIRQWLFEIAPPQYRTARALRAFGAWPEGLRRRKNHASQK